MWLAAQAIFHLRLLNVQTGSMRPAFWPHDALVMKQTGKGNLQVGQIVAYKSTRNPNELVTHRIARLDSQTRSFQAKGDALDVPDPVVRDSLIVGRVVAVLPGMGRMLGWVQTWPGLVVCVYLPAAAIVASELYKLEQTHKRARFYSLT